ncbi:MULTISPECIES: Hpt domain-containing protein [unclassified Sphingomonas]|uniref:Hpt domain-containing protein n=1 Tax=unclassified Sphingomonas TaxID=196159 RepID=UPI000A990AD3|nr:MULTISPECIES: Hpt domain-containing protein [unclassified Sphingomonas]
MNDGLIDQRVLTQTRAELGANFIRILGYFREDGLKSLLAIEQAMREQNAVAMVLPAHTLKGESRQFGAETLADMAEGIELIARKCVETHDEPTEALEHVARLRPTFQATLASLDRDSNPLAQRKSTGFGKRPVAL